MLGGPSRLRSAGFTVCGVGQDTGNCLPGAEERQDIHKVARGLGRSGLRDWGPGDGSTHAVIMTAGPHRNGVKRRKHLCCVEARQSVTETVNRPGKIPATVRSKVPGPGPEDFQRLSGEAMARPYLQTGSISANRITARTGSQPAIRLCLNVSMGARLRRGFKHSPVLCPIYGWWVPLFR